jgi:large subunit ribosomal protein L25
MESFIVNASARSDMGKGASRRLRLDGLVPGIIYGAGQDPKMISVAHTELLRHLDHEAFYSHILTVNLDGAEERVVLKDLQRHPAKPFALHVDFLRVSDDHKLRMTVPLHVKGSTTAPGVKRGGVATSYMTSVEVSCKPADLPEFIEVDMSNLDLAESIHLADLKVPEGVEFPALARGPQHNYAVIAILGGRNVT